MEETSTSETSKCPERRGPYEREMNISEQMTHKRRKYYKRGLIPKERVNERRVTCDFCDNTFNRHHYNVYHQHHCKCKPSSAVQMSTLHTKGAEEHDSCAYDIASQSVSRSQVNIEDTTRGGLDTHTKDAEIPDAGQTSTHVENPKIVRRQPEKVPTNLSDGDISSFFPETEDDSEILQNSDTEEPWLMPDVEHASVDMEEEISQDLEETRTPMEATLSVESRARTFVIWLCVFMLVWQARFFISDLAIEAFLKFFKDLLSMFSIPAGLLAFVSAILPSGMYGISRLLNFGKDPFKKFVVCRKCYSLYSLSDCFQKVEGRDEPRKCGFVKYPWQKKSFQKTFCNEPLLKIITLPSGNRQLYPYKWYCFRSIKDSLAEMVKRPGFEEQCEKWRQRNISDGIQEDIMDGQVWKDFNGRKYDFFTRERCYGLMLNVDWFRPFKHVQYSVGAIYLTVLNLPKEERFKRRNVILVGIIPHMDKEPKTNTFLSALTAELKEAWTEGFKLLSAKENKYVSFYLALLLIGCDIPACRKICGFLGHAAYRGCSKCLKYFPGRFGERDYGGFVRDDWPDRTHAKHVECCHKILDADKRKKVEDLEREYGLRYSVLLDLPYLDIVQMHIVDPMHNLFLGTAKRMVELWKQKGILSNEQMKEIQHAINGFVVPSDVGKIPYKIHSGFAEFTADQWKNWTLYFSIPCLQDVLPSQHLQVWKHFVRACHLLCSFVIVEAAAQKADEELMSFCTAFEELYGSESVTPNMHLHGHLIECIKNYGPIHVFWLFSFERYNGILGNQPSNKRSIELQMMRRFLRDGMMFSKVMDVSEECREIEVHLRKLQETRTRGTLRDMSGSDFIELCRSASCLTDIRNPIIVSQKSISYTQKYLWELTSQEVKNLQAMYRTIYPTSDFTVVPSCFKICQVLKGGDLLGSQHSRSNKSSFIMSYWPNRDGSIQVNPGYSQELAAGKILYFIEHNLLFPDKSIKKHLLAKVLWYQEVDAPFKDYYGLPVHVFYQKIYREERSASFVPVQRIRCKILTKTETMKTSRLSKEVLIAVPRDHFAGFL